MAKKTKDSNLSIEERLEQALIPNWDEPYKLPQNWCWVKLDSISEILNGYAFKSSLYTENGIRIIRITNVQDGFIEDEKPVFYPFNAKSEIEQYILKDNDLLMSLTGNVGRVALMKEEFLPAALNQRVACLRMKSPTISTKYLFYCLLQKQFIDDCSKSSKGSAQLNMSTEWLKGYSIPLPPTHEQLRIVEQIESLFSKLDEAKEKAQEVVDGFETRKAAILHKAFSGELTAKWREERRVTKNEWRNLTLDDVAEYKKGPFGSSITKAMFVPKGPNTYKVYEQGNAIRKALEYGSYYISQSKYDELRGFAIRPGDIIVSCAGTIGEIYKLPNNCEAGVINQALMRVRTYDNIDELYFIHYFSGVLKGDVIDESNGTAIKNIPPFKILKAMNILLPSLSEQKEIVDVIDRMLSKEQHAKETAEAVIEQIDTMKKAILARAFRGELGTNDPNEESAVELLKSVLMGNTNQQEPQKSSKKSISIPNHIEAALLTKLEKKIISLFYATESKVVSVDEIMSVSSKKIDIIDTLIKLEQRGILIRLNNSCYRIKE